MTSKTISDAVTNISGEYIEKAADYTVAEKSHKQAWFKWVAMAACLCLIIAGGWRLGVAFVGNQATDPFREGQLYEISSLDDLLLAQSLGGGNQNLPDCLAILQNFDLENATFELYYADGGYPGVMTDWYRLLISTEGDPSMMIVCVFNGRCTYEEQKVDAVFTKEATRSIEINGTTVEYAQMSPSLNYAYWYYSIFEYEGVIFDVRVQSDREDMIFTVLNQLLAPVRAGDTGETIDPVIASMAVFPDTESLENVQSATITSLDEESAYSFETLGAYLPTYVKKGYAFSKASLYETVMKDGTRYYMLRATYANGMDTYSVFVMNHHPGSEYTIYSGAALDEYISHATDDTTFHFSLDDLYFGFVSNGLSAADIAAVIDSMG